jgi:hypothetical protein
VGAVVAGGDVEGDGDGDGLGLGDALGVAVGDGLGLGDALGVAEGDALGVAAGVAPGDGLAGASALVGRLALLSSSLPPQPYRPVAAITAHKVSAMRGGCFMVKPLVVNSMRLEACLLIRIRVCPGANSFWIRV